MFIIGGLPTTILVAMTVCYAILFWHPEGLVRNAGTTALIAGFLSVPLIVIVGLAVMYRFGGYKSIDSAKANLKD